MSRKVRKKNTTAEETTSDTMANHDDIGFEQSLPSNEADDDAVTEPIATMDDVEISGHSGSTDSAPFKVRVARRTDTPSSGVKEMLATYRILGLTRSFNYYTNREFDGLDKPLLLSVVSDDHIKNTTSAMKCVNMDPIVAAENHFDIGVNLFNVPNQYYLHPGAYAIFGDSSTGKSKLVEKLLIPVIQSDVPVRTISFGEPDGSRQHCFWACNVLKDATVTDPASFVEALNQSFDEVATEYAFKNNRLTPIVVVDSLRAMVYGQSNNGATGKGGVNMAMFNDLTVLDLIAQKLGIALIFVINFLSLDSDEKRELVISSVLGSVTGILYLPSPGKIEISFRTADNRKMMQFHWKLANQEASMRSERTRRDAVMSFHHDIGDVDHEAWTIHQPLIRKNHF